MAEPDAESAEPACHASDASDALVDADVLRALSEFRLPGEPDPAEEVVRILLDLTPRRLDAMRGAAEAGDVAHAQRLAHMVGGSAGTVGALPLAENAARIERATTAVECLALIGALHSIFVRTQVVLRSFARGEA